MTNEPIIVWEKWRDPYGLDDIREIKNSIHSFSEESENEDDDYFDTEHHKQNDIEHHRHSLPVISTPLGLIPYTENTSCTKIFNFWTGHTNFDLTHKIAKEIEFCTGVETINVFTRYRFRISIGKVFDDAEVMKNINDTIYKMVKNNDADD